MALDKHPLDKHRKASRHEFEAAGSTRKVGRPLLRKPLQRRPDDSTDADITAASHADDPKLETIAPPPREDRAG